MRRVLVIAMSAAAIALSSRAQVAVADTVYSQANNTIIERLDNLNRKVIGSLAEGREATTSGSRRFKVIFLPPQERLCRLSFFSA